MVVSVYEVVVLFRAGTRTIWVSPERECPEMRLNLGQMGKECLEGLCWKLSMFVEI